MKRYVMAVAISFLAVSCSNKVESQHRRSTPGNTGTEPTAVEKDAEDEKQAPYADPEAKEPRPDGSTTLDLLKLAPPGVQFRLLSAPGLDRIFARVFPRRANGQYGAPCTTFNPNDCKDSFFTDAEAADVSALILSRGVQGFKTPQNFTLNYTRAVRSVLQRECRNLVVTELNRVVANPATANATFATVVGVPPAANFDTFLRKMLGINGLDVTLDTGAEGYLEAFQLTVANAPVAQQTTRKVFEDAYIATCMAIAMDPRVLIY